MASSSKLYMSFIKEVFQRHTTFSEFAVNSLIKPDGEPERKRAKERGRKMSFMHVPRSFVQL